MTVYFETNDTRGVIPRVVSISETLTTILIHYIDDEKNTDETYMIYRDDIKSLSIYGG